MSSDAAHHTEIGNEHTHQTMANIEWHSQRTTKHGQATAIYVHVERWSSFHKYECVKMHGTVQSSNRELRVSLPTLSIKESFLMILLMPGGENECVLDVFSRIRLKPF